MSILDRTSLEQSSLSDLHAIASELSIDSFRRLRKAELIEAILDRQSPGETPSDEPLPDADEVAAAVAEELREREENGKPTRRRRLRRSRRKDEDDDGRPAEEDQAAGDGAEVPGEPEPEPEGEPEPSPRSEGRRAAGGGQSGGTVEGVIEVLSGGSGFVRIHPPDPSDEDVYVSAAQVRRCELVSGDRVSGPLRPPRRSERFASLTRVETINGRPASELTDAGHSSDLPVGWPSVPLPLAGGDETISGILAAVPVGFGSRVTIVGPPQSGKSEILRRVASALAGREDLELRIVLAGVRPEEIPEWAAGSTAPAAALDLGASGDMRSQAVEAEVEQARRQAGRGAHTVVLIDTLDGVHEAATRKALAAARTTTDGGSVTVIATASHPQGGETTVLALSPILAAAARWPAIDLLRSWTVHPEKLVGEERAEEIRRLRAQALDG